jgi:predicted Zn-dependent protease with MMP-like domain
MDVSPERFEQLVARALDNLPDKYQRVLENVAVVIEESSDRPKSGNFLTLGRYQGVPRISRQGHNPTFPDRITFYREDLALLARTENDLKEQIKRTLWHEIGHHVGFSDAELRRLEKKHIKP